MASAEEVQKLLAALGGDPYGQALYNAATASAKVANQNSMEDLASRGILNSTVAGDSSNNINADYMTRLLPQLFTYKQQKDDKVEEARRYNEQMALKRQELANSVSQFNQQMALRRQEMAEQSKNNMNQYQYDLLNDQKQQGMWKDVMNNAGRRSYFKSDNDYYAQLRREGVLGRLAPDYYDKLTQMVSAKYQPDQAGDIYSSRRNKTNSSYRGAKGFYGHGGKLRYGY